MPGDKAEREPHLKEIKMQYKKEGLKHSPYRVFSQAIAFTTAAFTNRISLPSMYCNFSKTIALTRFSTYRFLLFQNLLEKIPSQ